MKKVSWPSNFTPQCKSSVKNVDSVNKLDSIDSFNSVNITDIFKIMDHTNHHDHSIISSANYKEPKKDFSRNWPKITQVIVIFVIVILLSLGVSTIIFEKTRIKHDPQAKFSAWPKNVATIPSELSSLSNNQVETTSVKKVSLKLANQKKSDTIRPRAFKPLGWQYEATCEQLYPGWKKLETLSTISDVIFSYHSCLHSQGYKIPDQVNITSLKLYNSKDYYLYSIWNDGRNPLQIASIVLTFPSLSYNLNDEEFNSRLISLGWQLKYSWRFQRPINSTLRATEFIKCAQLYVQHLLRVPTLNNIQPSSSPFSLFKGTKEENEYFQQVLNNHCYSFIDLQDRKSSFAFIPPGSSFKTPSINRDNKFDIFNIFNALQHLPLQTIVPRPEKEIVFPPNVQPKLHLKKWNLVNDKDVDILTPYDLIQPSEIKNLPVKITFSNQTVVSILSRPLPNLYFLGKPVIWSLMRNTMRVNLNVQTLPRNAPLKLFLIGENQLLAQDLNQFYPPLPSINNVKDRIGLLTKFQPEMQIIRFSKSQVIAIYL